MILDEQGQATALSRQESPSEKISCLVSGISGFGLVWFYRDPHLVLDLIDRCSLSYAGQHPQQVIEPLPVGVIPAPVPFPNREYMGCKRYAGKTHVSGKTQ
jgi:hypothetical protein